MTWSSGKTLLLRLDEITLGVVLWAAVGLKLFDDPTSVLPSFKATAAQYLGLSAGAAEVLGPILMITEGLLGFVLVLGLVPRLTSAIALLLFCGFGCYHLALRLSGQTSHCCACFGRRVQIDNSVTLLLGGVLILLALLFFVFTRIADDPQQGAARSE